MPFPSYLLTHVEFVKRGMKVHTKYVLSDKNNKDINHLLLYCNLARTVWLVSKLTLSVVLCHVMSCHFRGSCPILPPIIMPFPSYLLTHVEFVKRGMKVHTKYVLSDKNNKDINHLLLHCNLVRAIWLVSKLTLSTSLLQQSSIKQWFETWESCYMKHNNLTYHLMTMQISLLQWSICKKE